MIVFIFKKRILVAKWIIDLRVHDQKQKDNLVVQERDVSDMDQVDGKSWREVI